MLSDIRSNTKEIDNLMKKHGVQKWWLFEDIPNLKFPISADAHILIVPSTKLDLTQMRFLKIAMNQLLLEDLIKFYTPDELDNLVSQSRLDSSIRDLIVNWNPPVSYDLAEIQKRTRIAPFG